MWKKTMLFLGVLTIVITAFVFTCQIHNKTGKDAESFNKDCVESFNNKDNGTFPTEGYYLYTIDVKASTCGRYTLLIPIPDNPFLNSSEVSEGVSKIISNMKVTRGNAEFSLNQTEHGTALLIVGSGNITIKSFVKGRPSYGFFLNMDVYPNSTEWDGREHWIYLESEYFENITIYIKLVDEAPDWGGRRSEYTMPSYQEIGNGWKKITTRRLSEKYSAPAPGTNTPPKLIDYFPLTDFTINEGENLIFNIFAIDLDGQNLSYGWYVDNIFVSTNSTNYTFQTNYTSGGIYNITVVVSDGESNTTHLWSLTVINVNRPPEITNYSVPTNLTLKENENLTFNISAIDLDDQNLTYIWYLDNALVSTNNTIYTLQTNYTSSGTHNITVVVSNGESNTTKSWLLNVTNVNRPPQITNYSVPTSLTLKEGENFTFNISAIDLDGDNLTYAWYLDNILISNNSTNYTLQTNYTSAGIHNITVVVSDGESNITKSWLLNVTNVNLVPTANISSISPNPANKSEEITLIGYGNDTDGTIVAYQWRTNDTIIGTNPTIKISNLSVGKHTIYFKVQDSDGNWSDEVSTTVKIREKENVDGKKAFIPTIDFSIIIIYILISAVLIDLMRRRK